MNQHYSEADLLETYYTQPGESLPVMMHLADCSDCAARYERLERKIRGLSACEHEEKPETFWAQQRVSVMRKVQARRVRPAVARIAAAAAIAVVIGGGAMTWDRKQEVKTVQQVPAAATEVTVPSDPWESEALDEYGSMVAWESWEETSSGDQSL